MGRADFLKNHGQLKINKALMKSRNSPIYEKK